MNNIYLLIAAVAGAGIALQVIINTQLRVNTATVWWAAAVQFAVGFGGLVLAALLMREPLPTSTRGPWWMWVGGLLGATYIVVSVVLSRRIGTAVLLASTVVGQLVMALLIDHYGLLGAPVYRLSVTRVLGVALLIAGVIVIRWR
jgi:bacterial/archaeal transporter family-2 protein